ncbi:uncharacterized protein [Nicotiana tomentosiformis]|uniref:uncharacterized protein n=1 Tax=Nicotiana tomentosiformis TaxID=4098 RepID=UPI00051C2CC1|nr:uncharacterized protein LOC104087856 [Nicotiana tomentosiformis]
MVPSPLRSKTILKHARSSSFPSTSHPIVSQFDEHLCRVNTSLEATSSCLSSFTCKLGDLGNLFDYTEDLLQLPHIQQAISLDGDELLEGYIKVLDVCATIKDLLSNEKQNKQDLLSALRRRRNTNDIISSYLTSRKKSKKMIQNILKDLKGMMKKNVIASETLAVVSMLKEVQSVTLGLFKSLLLHVNGTGSQSSSWSLLSKIVRSKKEEVEANEFDNVDAALCSKNIGTYDELQNQLREMEATIEVLEQGLECFFRRLIKTRVSLLNILSH